MRERDASRAVIDFNFQKHNPIRRVAIIMIDMMFLCVAISSLSFCGSQQLPKAASDIIEKTGDAVKKP